MMTLQELADKVDREELLGDIVVSPDQWRELVYQVSPFQIIAATPERPAWFWFRDRRVVTPASKGQET
jgi:hypothetical protein